MITLKKPLAVKQYTLLPLDFVLGILSFYLAFYWRFDGAIPSAFMESFLQLWFLFAVFKTLGFVFSGVYRRIWKYAAAADLFVVAVGLVWGVLLLLAAAYFLHITVPRSVYVFTLLLDLFISGGLRALPKLYNEKSRGWFKNRSGKRILIVGAGDAGVLVAKELLRQTAHHYVPIGFLDDEPLKQKARILGLPVLGTRQELSRIVKRFFVQEVLIAMPSASGPVIKSIVDECRKLSIPVRTLPRMYDIINGQISVDLIREVKLEDLLGREPVQLDMDSIRGSIFNKKVLVTGAGGSIGSELCRQICRLAPAELVILGHDENPLFETEMELRQLCEGIVLKSVIGDVKDVARMNTVFAEFKPQLVFHAAAHKHVPLMEEHPAEGFKNNVMGTKTLAEAADRYEVETFIMISTDKAVNPTSVMGATKRIAEMVIQNMNETSYTKFAAVRFGNVLGSRGSVIPIFQEQIRRGGPVTVTHPEMRRYFMTIPEAVQLVLQAGSMTEGGEIFILDMGEPVLISEMVKELIHLSGFEPDKEIAIEYIGIRPGEKLFEELLSNEEGLSATKNERIFVSRQKQYDPIILKSFMEGDFDLKTPQRPEIFRLLATMEGKAPGAEWIKPHVC